MAYNISDYVQNKTLTIVDESLLEGGTNSDKLRASLKNGWVEDTVPDSDVPFLRYSALDINPSVTDLRGVEVKRVSPADDADHTNPISKVEFNPTKVTRISDDLIIPNFKIPMRIYGNDEIITSNIHWDTVLKGGTFQGHKYEPLINMTSLFYDTAINLELPYSAIEINSSYGNQGYPATITNQVQITNNYNHYSPDIGKYQNLISAFSSELLIPNIYFFENVYGAPSFTPDEEGKRALYTLTSHLGSASMSYLTLIDDTLSSPGQILANTLQNTTITGSGAHLLHNHLYKMSYYPLSASATERIIEQNKNLVFDAAFFQERNPTVGVNGELIARSFPYYNKISFERHVATITEDPSGRASSDEFIEGRNNVGLWNTQYANYITKALEEKKLSNQFLESLKNLVLGEFSGLSLTEKNYTTYTQEEVITGSHSTFQRSLQGTIKQETYKQVDFLSFLTYAADNLSEGVSHDIVSFGPTTFDSTVSMSDVGSNRFYNGGKIADIIGDIILPRLGQAFMQPFELAQLAYNAEAFGAGDNGSPVLQANLYNTFFNTTTKYKEVIAYRIEKIGGFTTEDQTNANVLQNFWIFNSDSAPDQLVFYDSQVKYGEEYTYKIYAYVLTAAHRYKYTDFAVTKNDQRIPAGEGTSEISEGQNLNYLTFYDPETDMRTSQTFYEGRGLTQEFAVQSMVARIPNVDQADFNAFLTGWNSQLRNINSTMGWPEGTNVFDLAGFPDSPSETAFVADGLLPTNVSKFRERLIKWVHKIQDGITYDYADDTMMERLILGIASDAYGVGAHPSMFESSFSLMSTELLTEAETVNPNASPLARINEAASSAQELSTFRFLADCHLLIEPCLKMIEVPIYSKNLRVYDNPPNGLTLNPFQHVDTTNRVGFDMSYDGFKYDMAYPNVITEQDITVKANYLHAKDYMTDHIGESLSPQTRVEVYRLEHKPTKYSDFQDHLLTNLSLKIPNSQYSQITNTVTNQIRTNKKYYFLFRFMNELGMPGHLSPIMETELVDDGGYVYARFDTLAGSEMEVEDHIEITSPFKKLIQISPVMSQLIIDDSEVDYMQSASEQINNLKIGLTATTDSSDSIWDSTFKIRLISKKTGKKIDLNVTYTLEPEDVYTSPATATPAVPGGDGGGGGGGATVPATGMPSY
jgi:hypothetical protein